MFERLANVTDLAGLEAFSNGLGTMVIFENPVRRRFCELDANVDGPHS